jgi:hypothetical protein
MHIDQVAQQLRRRGGIGTGAHRDIEQESSESTWYCGDCTAML